MLKRTLLGARLFMAERAGLMSHVAPLFKRALAIGLPLLLSACADDISFLHPHGAVAAAQRSYFFDILLILLIVVLPVLLLTPIIAWHYRIRNTSAAYEPNWSFSWVLEILIWGVPVCIVVVLSFWLWNGARDLDPYRPIASTASPLQVEVIGYDWKWLFIYPKQKIATVGQFAFPVDRPVALRLTSATVMQSFFIPALASQVYAMGGMTTRLNLSARDTGSFLGENAQYNGKGFQQQKFSAVSMSETDFEAWVKKVRKSGIPLQDFAYHQLSEHSTLAELRHALHADGQPPGVVYFRGVPDELFNKLVAFTMNSPKSATELSDLNSMPGKRQSVAGAPQNGKIQD